MGAWVCPHGEISIHAPREGGDCIKHFLTVRKYYFNPRPPRGGRLSPPFQNSLPRLFQSTPPARGATTMNEWQQQIAEISIHAPREGGDQMAWAKAKADRVFQSTPPARGATGRSPLALLPARSFQSTPPARGATKREWAQTKEITVISIHAPREGGDRSGAVRCGSARSISIHAPREGGDTETSCVPSLS